MGSVVVADEAQLPADEHFDAMVTYLRFKHAKDVLQLLPKIETDLKLPTGSLQFRQVARRSPLRVGLVRLPDLSRNTEAEIDLGLAFRMARLTAENRT